MKQRISVKTAVASAMAATLAVSGVVAATATPAYAENGSFTVTQAHNTSATYDVYQVFTANIDNTNKADTIAWTSNSAIASAVQTFIADTTANTGASQTYDAYLVAQGYISSADAAATSGPGKTRADAARASAQNALEYISAEITSSAAASPATTPATKTGTSFAANLAKALSGLTPTGTATSGTAYSNAEGFYLFVSTPSTVGDGEVGTAPMWVPLGGSSTSGTAKEALPTVNKEVKEDSGSTFGKGADANKGQDLEYRITASVPSNIDAFETYRMVFTDTLPSGMTVKGITAADGFSVKVNGVDVTSQVITGGSKGTTTYANDVLTVTIPDIKDLGQTVTSATEVVVSYLAHCDADATIGSTGNTNSAVLSYSNDPTWDGTGTEPTSDTTGSSTKTYTYELDMTKKDAATGRALQGAKFTMQVPAGAADGNGGKYVQADGSLGTTAYEFTSGADGTFTIPRIDAGTYTLHETQPPSGYKTAADVSVTITSSINQTTGELNTTNGLTATISGGVTGQATNTAINSVTPSTGIIDAQTSDVKEFVLPITGMTREMGLVTLGVIVIAGGSFWVIRSRRKQNKED